MNYVGIDIGSTAAKVSIIVQGNTEDIIHFVMPTGWSSVETAKSIEVKLSDKNINPSNSKIVATGYGRISVPYADKTITEISCHGKGAFFLTNEDCTVIDIGGQDTKIISEANGIITNFTMNDKCAAGTGRFLELMANTLGVDINTLCEMASKGKATTISSMCTVFAESEVISLIGSGKPREDIAYGILDSITEKVKTLAYKHKDSDNYFLTGGLCGNKHIIEKLSLKLGNRVKTHKLGKYAGSIGAAVLAMEIKKGLK